MPSIAKARRYRYSFMKRNNFADNSMGISIWMGIKKRLQALDPKPIKLLNVGLCLLMWNSISIVCCAIRTGIPISTSSFYCFQMVNLRLNSAWLWRRWCVVRIEVLSRYLFSSLADAFSCHFWFRFRSIAMLSSEKLRHTIDSLTLKVVCFVARNGSDRNRTMVLMVENDCLWIKALSCSMVLWIFIEFRQKRLP